MFSRDLNLLHPDLRVKCIQFVTGCLEVGVHALITSTGRTQAEQEILWMQGRFPLDMVNKRRLKAGWTLLTEAQNKKVTWTMQSMHLIREDGFCRAFDFCLTNNGKAYWDVKVSVDDDEIPDYEEAGKVAMDLGLDWGGAWTTTKDYPHCQLEI